MHKLIRALGHMQLAVILVIFGASALVGVIYEICWATGQIVDWYWPQYINCGADDYKCRSAWKDRTFAVGFGLMAIHVAALIGFIGGWHNWDQSEK